MMRLLENPKVRGVRENDPGAVAVHRAIIADKRLLREAYARFYAEFVTVSRRLPAGPRIELGAGGGWLKRYLPGVVTTDVMAHRWVDAALSADALPFADASIRAFFLLDVFHHIARPEAFLREASRCLLPGGVIVMVEPANTPFGRFVRKRFHHEAFDERGTWDLGDADANLALPWIVFVRDRERLRRAVPGLRLRRYEAHTPFRFLLSGGVSYRSLVPGAFSPLVTFVEAVVAPLNPVLGMHVTIELERTPA